MSGNPGYRAGFVFPRKAARRLLSRANICCRASCWRNNAWCSCRRAANRWACAWLSDTMICFCWSSASLRCSAFTIFCCKSGILKCLKKICPGGPFQAFLHRLCFLVMGRSDGMMVKGRINLYIKAYYSIQTPSMIA